MVFVVLQAAACSGGGDGAGDGGGDGGWQPPHVYLDTGYTEEVGEILAADLVVNDLELDGQGLPWLATATGVMSFDGSGFRQVALPDVGALHDLCFDAQGRLAAAGEAGVVLDGQALDLPAGARPAFVAWRRAGGIWIAGENLAGWWDGQYHAIAELAGQTVRTLAEDAAGDWYAATAGGVFTATGTVTNASGLPSNDVRSLTLCPDGTLWAGTAAGLARRDAASGTWSAFLGADGLHYGDVNRLACDGEGNLLVATRRGGSIFRADGTRRYYFGRNWTAGDDIRALARAGDGTVWLAGPDGVSRVRQLETTLAAKAALLDEITQARHVRLGYTSTENALREWGDVESFYNHDDDNDGQWTAMYLASQCFRWAVTGEQEARENADVAAAALMKLEQVTPVRGFFARSIVPGNECAAKQQGPGEWHLSGDGQWCWKGDTSSDEFVGHVFGLSLYHDLVADDEQRARVADTLGAIVGYIVDNGYRLLDIDGEPTEHGRFDPDFMENDLSAIYGDAGLNSAMILGGLLAVHHMTGEQRFLESFDYLARERNYRDYVACIEEKNTYAHINHDSEEMSFLAMYTLLRYNTDERLEQLWLHGSSKLDCRGLDYLWEVQRPERNPEFNMIFAALARTDDYELDESVETLQKLPRDLILWGLDMSHRWDAVPDPHPDRFGRPQNSFVFSYDERQVMRWAENPYAFRQRGDGHSESSGTFWLLPYWMGRYHGFIR